MRWREQEREKKWYDERIRKLKKNKHKSFILKVVQDTAVGQ